VCSTPHLVPGKAQLEPDNRYVIISFHYFMKFTSYIVEIHPEDSLATVQHKKLSDIDLLIDSIYSNKIFSTKKRIISNFRISETSKSQRKGLRTRCYGFEHPNQKIAKQFLGGTITGLSSHRMNQETSTNMCTTGTYLFTKPITILLFLKQCYVPIPSFSLVFGLLFSKTLTYLLERITLCLPG
jgi:hypothetical protein